MWFKPSNALKQSFTGITVSHFNLFGVAVLDWIFWTKYRILVIVLTVLVRQQEEHPAFNKPSFSNFQGFSFEGPGSIWSNSGKVGWTKIESIAYASISYRGIFVVCCCTLKLRIVTRAKSSLLSTKKNENKLRLILGCAIEAFLWAAVRYHNNLSHENDSALRLAYFIVRVVTRYTANWIRWNWNCSVCLCRCVFTFVSMLSV